MLRRLFILFRRRDLGGCLPAHVWGEVDGSAEVVLRFAEISDAGSRARSYATSSTSEVSVALASGRSSAAGLPLLLHSCGSAGRRAADGCPANASAARSASVKYGESLAGGYGLEVLLPHLVRVSGLLKGASDAHAVAVDLAGPEVDHPGLVARCAGGVILAGVGPRSPAKTRISIGRLDKVSASGA